MGAVLTLLQRYIQAPRAGDLALRAAIIGFYAWAFRALHYAWPSLSLSVPVHIKNVVYPLIVYAVFIWLIFMVFGSLLLSIVGMTDAARSFGRFLGQAGFFLFRVIFMTFINLAVFALRIGVAAIVPGDVLTTCADAATHFAERESDMLFNK